MDRTSSTRNPKAPARLWPGLTLDGETGQLGPDRLFIQRTPIGYVCAGLGDPARLLRLAFEGASETGTARKHENDETNPIFAAACRLLDKAVAAGGVAKARRLGLEVPLGAIDDPALRRLAIAAALIKAGFDPDQARDEDGRWTSGGGGGDAPAADITANVPPPVTPAIAVGGVAAAASAEVLGAPAVGAGWSLWSGRAMELLPRVAELSNIFALAGSLILIPSNRSGGLESSGTLPDNPDIDYYRSEGRLQLFQRDPDGERTKLYDGYPGDDDFYRDAAGNIIARDLGYEKGFVLDPSAVTTLTPPTMDARAKEKEKDPEIVAAQQRLLSQARTIVRTADPAEICPDPDLDKPGSESASPRAQAYQTQVTQLPYGVAFKLNGVFFDGCRYWSDGAMLEVKRDYLWAMDGPSDWQPWFVKNGKLDEMKNQMEAQSIAAGTRRVEWHFADEQVADYFRAWQRSITWTISL